MKLLATTFMAAITLMLASSANAQIIFDAIGGDALTTHSNGTNAAPTFALNPTDATLTRSDAQLSHFASNLNLQALNGGLALTATDVVQVSWTVDSITGFTTGDTVNGIEFGLVSDNDFRGNPNLGTISRFRGLRASVANSNRVGHGFGNLLTGNNNGAQSENEATEEAIAAGLISPNGFEGSLAGFADGFTVVQTITSAGVTTQYTGIDVTDQAGVSTGGSTLTVGQTPFVAVPGTPFDYLTFINGAHFYAGADLGAVDGGVITFSNATVEINPPTVPEPSTFGALIALGGLFVRRRRRV